MRLCKVENGNASYRSQGLHSVPQLRCQVLQVCPWRQVAENDLAPVGRRIKFIRKLHIPDCLQLQCTGLNSIGPEFTTRGGDVKPYPFVPDVVLNSG
jgi:hypothetical protein